MCRISETAGEGKTFDYMVCDRKCCEECGGEEGSEERVLGTGWPFVHSCDTIRGQKKKTLFKPHRPAHGSLEITGNRYERDVQLETEEGPKTFRAQICGHAECSVRLGTSARP